MSVVVAVTCFWCSRFITNQMVSWIRVITFIKRNISILQHMLFLLRLLTDWLLPENPIAQSRANWVLSNRSNRGFSFLLWRRAAVAPTQVSDVTVQIFFSLFIFLFSPFLFLSVIMAILSSFVLLPFFLCLKFSWQLLYKNYNKKLYRDLRLEVARYTLCVRCCVRNLPHSIVIQFVLEKYPL